MSTSKSRRCEYHLSISDGTHISETCLAAMRSAFRSTLSLPNHAVSHQQTRIVRKLLKFRRILQDSWSQFRNFGEFLEDFEIIQSMPFCLRQCGSSSNKSLEYSLAYSCMCVKKWFCHLRTSPCASLQHPIKV